MKQEPLHTAPPAPIRLGLWNVYFLAKLLLLWRGMIGFHALENLAFAALLLVPLASRQARRWRNLACLPLAAALLYYDSWLPPAARAWSEAGRISGFSATYLLELAGRFVNWQLIALLALGWAAYRIAAVYVRVGVPVMAALLVLAVVQPAPPAATGAVPAQAASAAAPANDTDGALRDFFAREAGRKVVFAAAPDHAAPFDIVLIHICSLSWDDLQMAGLADHPLWKQFDFLLRQFNSASSYSGPAALRLQLAACGQRSHIDLFNPASPDCMLMPSLRSAGYQQNLVLNHDGHFDDFLKLIRTQGVTGAPMPLDGMEAPMRSFDDSPIYDDLAVLTRWQQQRDKVAAERVVTYYNTVSLHDGNRLLANSKMSSADSYKLRLAKLLDGLHSYLQLLENSGRRTVVALVPEHGAALRGDQRQVAGLREIPSPAITLVPVGIKVIGKDARRLGEQVELAQPTSYMALSHILARLLAKPPYGEAGFMPGDYAAGLPGTDLVSQNEATVLMRREGKFVLRQGGSTVWETYQP
jgi:cellulose synthase operon protein YhjU